MASNASKQGAAVQVTYDCFSIAGHSPLRKPQGYLPLQTSPIANLGWASAFIDHAGQLIQAREQKYEEVAKQYTSAVNTINRNNSDIEKLKKENAALHHKIEHLDADVARQAGAYRRLDEAFDHFRSRAKTEKEALTKELSATRKKLNSALSNVKLLEAKLLAADKAAHENWLKEREDDVKDHQSINDLHQALDKETKANAVLQVSLDEKIKQLLEVQHELQVAKDGQAASRKEIARLNEQIDQLKQDIADKERTIGRYESDLASLRDGNAALEAEKTKLSLDFNNMFAELHKTEQELSVAREEVAGLSDTVSKQKAAIQGLTDQLQDQKDQNVQLRSQSEKTISELLSRVEALLKHDVEDEQKLAELAKQMEILSDALNKARADDEQDKQTIEGLKNSVKKLNGIQKKLQDKIGELTGHDAGDDVEIEEMKKIIADLKAKVAETVAQKSASEGTADELKKQLDNMQKKVDEVTSDDAKDKLEIEKLKTAQENGEKAIKDLETQANAAKKASEDAKKKALEAEAARQSAEAAAAKAAAERDEAHKPVLPNDVKLANPIALVGSLKGAPRDVDDETFSINCSFPVTLFNTKSSKLYISTNGLFTLDRASDKYAYQKFPYRGWITQPLPDHVLAPFWADLYIYKGTPQGIYYEETGKAPNRKLEIEWYVSRYSNAKQYYHFTLTVEEAKPNMATFKYFDALDKGGKCTIGIQGPKTSSMFSYNQEKTLPGTQVTFDTGKNTFSASTFKVAEVAVSAPATVEMPAAKTPDIKAPNVVSVAVNEVVDI